MEVNKTGKNNSLHQNQIIRLISGIVLLILSFVYNLFQYPNCKYTPLCPEKIMQQNGRRGYGSY